MLLRRAQRRVALSRARAYRRHRGGAGRDRRRADANGDCQIARHLFYTPEMETKTVFGELADLIDTLLEEPEVLLFFLGLVTLTGFWIFTGWESLLVIAFFSIPLLPVFGCACAILIFSVWVFCRLMDALLQPLARRRLKNSL